MFLAHVATSYTIISIVRRQCLLISTTVAQESRPGTGGRERWVERRLLGADPTFSSVLYTRQDTERSIVPGSLSASEDVVSFACPRFVRMRYILSLKSIRQANTTTSTPAVTRHGALRLVEQGKWSSEREY